MKGFSGNRVKNFNDVSGFCTAGADSSTDGVSLTKETELESDLFDAEFERYSEVSFDVSSDSSLRYKIQAKQNCYTPVLCKETSAAYGSLDEGRLRPFKLSEISRNLPYSDDNMSDILPLDQKFIQSNRTMEEQLELRYLQELLHSTDYYSEHDDRVAWDLSEWDSSTAHDLYWNMAVSHEASANFFPSDSLILNKLYEEEDLRSVMNNEDSSSSHQVLRYPAINQSFVIDNKKKKNQHRDFQRHQKRRNKLPNEEQKPTPPSALTFKKQNEAKPCSPAVDAEKRVFLGGLPAGMTERSLRQQLAQQGYKVIKRPKIIRGFAPEVMMRSVQEAKELVKRGTIMISGVDVEVRPFNSFMKQSESRKIPRIQKRSVFLGGLSKGTTAKDIQDVFKKLGVRVVNYPLAKFGFSRQVILESTRQAKRIIKMKKVLINGTYVDVRPYVRQPSKRKNHKQMFL